MANEVKHTVLVLSGKGGVGKSTVSVQLALTLKNKGYKVGLLDVDLCGPSAPCLLNLEGRSIYKSPEGWVPVYVDQEQQLGVMSIGFLVKNRDTSIIWRGPKKTGMINQFLTGVHWGKIDYLIVDTPPGTSDEHLTVIEKQKEINCDGAILVTTPQKLSLEDVRKEYTLCKKTGIPVIGIVENMSGFVCSDCNKPTYIFSSGGGKSLSEYAQVPFFGQIPIDPRIGYVENNLKSINDICPKSPAVAVFDNIVNILTEKA